jgi:predicted transcriptional regulator
MQTNPTNTYLISVRPTWADAFFFDRNPKTVELRKGSFGACLKPGDSIAIYGTMPVAEILGTVRVLKREILPLEQLWNESQHGRLARVSHTQFDDYYANQRLGVGVWVTSAELFPKPIPLYRLRQNRGSRWQPPQQLHQLTHEQMATIDPHQRQPSATMLQMKRALLCCR